MTVPVHPVGRGDVQLQHRVGQQILDHAQRDMGGALGGDREVPHRLSVAEQHHGDHLLVELPPRK